MKKALKLSRAIALAKPGKPKRKAILRWCAEVKRFLSVSGDKRL